jgi:hypothetical protein
MRRLKDLHAAGRPADAKLIHILSSGIKAAATWTKIDVLQQCREACGGMGFLAANKIGPMITDTNVDVTFEGARRGRRAAACAAAPRLAAVWGSTLLSPLCTGRLSIPTPTHPPLTHSRAQATTRC